MKFDPFLASSWELAGSRQIVLGPKAVIMGILNVTPDSFSDGGKYDHVDTAVKQARKMFRQGAQIIDIGGESTRPGAAEISPEVEQSRILPVIEALGSENGILLSVDTCRAATAELAMQAGAHIINDVWGFQKDKQIASVAARHNAGCVLMHTGRERAKDPDPIRDQIAFLKDSLKIARAAGISSERIVIDPGYGFAKNADENISILAHMEALFELGYPVLTGTSRKRFVGEITGRGVNSRDIGTVATTVVARLKGSAVFRVHDVAKNVDALRMADAVLQAEGKTRL